MLRMKLLVVGLLLAVGCGGMMPAPIEPPPGHETSPPEAAVTPPPGSSPRVTMAGQPKGVLPLFTLGDVNEDGTVDSTDVELVWQLAEGQQPAAATCPAAADVDRDGAVGPKDGEHLAGMTYYGPLAAPALVSQPALPCAYSRLRFGAPAQLRRDEPTQVRLFGGLTVDDVEVQVPAPYELVPAEDRRGWVLGGAEALAEGGRVVITLATGGVSQLLTLTRGACSVEGACEWQDFGSDPRDLPLPTVFGEEIDDSGVCPQRHLGCQALVLDFSKAVFLEADLDRTYRALKGIDCHVEYAAPDFLEMPERVTVKVRTAAGEKEEYGYEDPAAAAAVKAHNRVEWAKVTRAIAAHRAALEQGAEVALEIVNGHGSKGGSYSCGVFSNAFDTGVGDMSRSAFNTGNWRAARGHVCTHFVEDMTCYGGQSVRSMRALNNTGWSSCEAASPAVDHGWHAAYTADVAVSLARPDGVSLNGEVFAEDVGLASWLFNEGRYHEYHRVSRMLRERLPDGLHDADYEAHYADQGYNRHPTEQCTAHVESP